MKYLAPVVLAMISLLLGQPLFAADASCLESAVMTWAGDKVAPTYRHAFADLDGDGRDDAVVLVTGPDYCGSGGCTLVIFRGEEDGFKAVSSSTVTREPVFMLRERMHGWRTLSVMSAGGGARRGMVMMRFNGSKYPANPSLQPRAGKRDLRGAKALLRDRE